MRSPGLGFTLTVFLVVAVPAAGAQQDRSLTTINPLAALKDEIERVLDQAGVPFSDEQERAIVLMMEERRQASENLFGDLMDFRSGPTTTQQAERLQSAIEWLRQEFLDRLRTYLRQEQLDVWLEHQAAAGVDDGAGGGRRGDASGQTQYVRLNNNNFTSERSSFQRNTGGGTEIIARGGSGVWHGSGEFQLQDESLNARNAFAANKPEYQERQIRVEFGGPVIRNRLTASVSASQNEAENVGTIRATLPDGLFALGITRPTVNRSIGARATYQVADAHTLRTNVFRRAETRKNQGIGGFSLPERASDSRSTFWNLDVRQFSVLGSGSLYETRVEASSRDGRTIPASEAARINVLDAFNGGGAQNRSESRGQTYTVRSLYTRAGETFTTKLGADVTYRSNRSESWNNFGGTFTFSSLEAYLAQEPLTYRVTRGTPLLEARQVEFAGFVQNDLPIGSQVTLMFGLRYDVQSNLPDRTNASPRVGVAYALGPSTVLRGGGGIFYDGLSLSLVETQRRLDGTRQHEIVIDRPSYPDPDASGTIRQTSPSVRVTDPDLRAPYTTVGMISLERTFRQNLLVTVSYDYQRELHQFRLRNLNAPFDSTAPEPRACRPDTPPAACVRPDPARGNVENLESTATEAGHSLRIGARQRFSIFNVTGTYMFQRVYGDSIGVRLPMDNYDPRADWGRGSSPSHSVSSRINARLPFGIFLTGSLRANSARYYTITTGRDDNRDSRVNDRPPGVPRNSARGPAYLNLDLNVSKAIFIGGSGSGRNVNLFANASNVLNRVHYGTPSGVMTSPNFGRSTSAQNPREIQIGVRVQF